MAQADSGEPKVGMSMPTLGVRVKDLHPRLSGLVDPMDGGVSVSPAGEEHLPQAAQTLLEEQRGIVFALDTDSLPRHLNYRPDLHDRSHGFIEPASTMGFENYQRAVQGTSDLWEPV